jgi:Co/Zn/Cd efflux system component
MSALSCHLVIEECDLEKSMEIVEKVKNNLKEKFHIEHATIETELVECPPDQKSV